MDRVARRCATCVVAVVVLAWCVPGGAAAASSSLAGVSCTAPTACTAAGTHSVGGLQTTLAERWNGSSWSIQPTPSTGLANTTLSGVSCASATACTAVGDDGGALVERWDGSRWSVQLTPNAGSTKLTAVSCPPPTACVAVGYNRNLPLMQTTLAELWKGSSWSIEPTGSGLGLSPVLNSVSCASSTACTAVGNYGAPEAGAFPLAEHWDGSSWSFQDVPVPGGPYGNCSRCSGASFDLTGVSCASATSCVAVGYNANAPLVERWDGTSWTIESTPSSAGGLNDVSCGSSTSCVAVGHVGNTPLVERWDGTSWAIQSTPTSPGVLNGVSCASPTVCTAVGSNGLNTPLAEHWDGTSWTLLATAAPADCVVPKLFGKSLTVARKMIRAAQCTVGKVKVPHRPKHAAGKHRHWKLIVGRQSPRAATVEPNGTSVTLTLVYTPAHK